LIKPDK